jgi:malate synthase
VGSELRQPNIDAITMTYGYMRIYEDRVRRAVNTPDATGSTRCGRAAWSRTSRSAPKRRRTRHEARRAGGEREQREGASGKWVAHWKMVHIVRPVWEKVGEDNQLGRKFPPLTYTSADADGLMLLEPRRAPFAAPAICSASRCSTATRSAGLQAAALKPADFFGNDDVLYLMEDMATAKSA